MVVLFIVTLYEGAETEPMKPAVYRTPFEKLRH